MRVSLSAYKNRTHLRTELYAHKGKLIGKTREKIKIKKTFSLDSFKLLWSPERSFLNKLLMSLCLVLDWLYLCICILGCSADKLYRNVHSAAGDFPDSIGCSHVNISWGKLAININFTCNCGIFTT